MIVGCGDNSDKTVNDLVNHFKSQGLKIIKEGKVKDSFGQIDSARLKINKNENIIWIYKFDLKEPGSKSVLDKWKSTNTHEFWGMSEPVRVNGCFVLEFYQKHPDKENIIKAFESF